MEKTRKLTFLAVIAVAFLFVLVKLPLLPAITETMLTAKLNDFLPGYHVELEKSKFYLFKGLDAEVFSIAKDKQAVLSFKKFRVAYGTPFVFTGRGKLKLTSGALDIKKNHSSVKFLNFLSNVLDSSFEEKLVLESFSLDSNIGRKKIVIDCLEARREDFKIVATGFLERGQGMDFTVDIYLSEEFASRVSESTKKVLFDTHGDDFNRIRLKVYGSPSDPSFKIRTNFLELNIS